VSVDKKGRNISSITGYLPYELSDNIEEGSTYPLFHFNSSFFDHKLNKTSIQLLVISNSQKEMNEKGSLQELLRKSFFPFIDYKALAALMYK